MKGLIIDAARQRQRDYRSDPDTRPLTAIAPKLALPFAATPCASFNQAAPEIPELDINIACWGGTIFSVLDLTRFLELFREIFHLFGVARSDLPFAEPWYEVSMISKDNITGLKMTREGNSIAGTIEFEDPKCYKGAIDFVARKGTAGWRVEEFRLPVMGLHLDRIGDTSWRERKPFRADGLLPTHRGIDRDNPAIVRTSNDESLIVEVDGKPKVLFPQTMRRYLTGRTVLVLADENVTAGQLFEVLSKLKSLATPGALFYLASESPQSADTIRIDSAPILMTSGAEFRRGQLGDATVAEICMTTSFTSVSQGQEPGWPVDRFEDIFPFITDVKSADPSKPFHLAADPNVPALRLATTLDKLAGANVKRVVLAVGSVYRGVLFELMERSPEE